MRAAGRDFDAAQKLGFRDHRHANVADGHRLQVLQHQGLRALHAARAGETTDVGDIRLQFAAAFRVTGVVVDEAAQPVEHARVRLVPFDAPHGALPTTGTTAHTGAVGEFRLSDVLQGQYLLVAVPLVALRHDASPDARGRYTTSFVLGGANPETADGTTRQFRDELLTIVPVDVSSGSVFDVRVIVTRR